MGIRDPVAGALSAYSLSVRATSAVTQAVLTGAPLDIPAYEQAAKATMEAGRTDREREDDEEIDRLMTEMTAGRKRTITRLRDANCSQWLTAMPVEEHAISPTQFRDAVHHRLALEPAGLPAKCDGCGKPGTLEHFMNCKKGGLVTLTTHRSYRYSPSTPTCRNTACASRAGGCP